MPTAAPDVAAAWTAGPAPVASGWTAGPAPTTPPATGSGNRFSDALDRLQSPTFAATNQKDASGNAVVDPNTVGTFASHFVSQINPIPLGQLVPFPQAL